MLYIIIGIILIGILFTIIGEILEWLDDLMGGTRNLVILIILLIAGFLIGSWMGLLSVLVLWAMGYGVIKGISQGANYVGNQVKEHDKRKKEIAAINQKTKKDMEIHDNDESLMNELSKNCQWLGYMSDDMWSKKLPNYARKEYSTSFDTITHDFAKQNEQQYILQNDDWVEPFKVYILNHPNGSTVTKMLHEVNCPQLKMTHSTPDGDLLNTWLDKRTKAANKDVPALFASTFIKEMNEDLFTPTPYLKKLYENETESHQTTEIDFNDL